MELHEKPQYAAVIKRDQRPAHQDPPPPPEKLYTVNPTQLQLSDPIYDGPDFAEHARRLSRASGKATDA